MTGQPPFSVGLGFSPANGTGFGGFNFTSAFPQASDAFSSILSSFFNGTNVTTFPIIPPGFNGTSLPFSGFNGTMSPFPGLNGTTLPFANGSYPSGVPSGFPSGIPSGLPSGFPSDLPSGSMTILPYPTFNPSVLPFPVASDVASSIQVGLSSVAVSISDALPSLPTTPVVPTSSI